jgi:8-oxo-dGTP pyrophosphatase MutT (NUDIX family)
MELIADLKKRLGENLPAQVAHSRLMNYPRKTAADILAEKLDVKKSAVLCLLFEEAGEWKFYLMLRNSYKGVHSAQVSFPGGKREETDKDYKETALREAQEELGINPNEVEILGELSTMYIPPSNFLVYPFVGVVRAKQNIAPDPIEVKEVIVANLKDILGLKAVSNSFVKVSGGAGRIKVNHYTVNNHIVWGATGMILAELAYILEDLGAE